MSHKTVTSTTVKAEHYDIHGHGVRPVEVTIEFRESGLVSILITSFTKRPRRTAYSLSREAWDLLRQTGVPSFRDDLQALREERAGGGDEDRTP